MPWRFYADAGLTTELATLALQLPDTGGSADTVVYFGNPSPGKTLQAASDPGTDAITLMPTDADAGPGLATSNLRLALSYAGLASATPGAALALGTTLASVAPVAVYLRITAAATAPGAYSNLALATTPVIEA